MLTTGSLKNVSATFKMLYSTFYKNNLDPTFLKKYHEM